MRVRYVSVPNWFLGLFTKENVPLSSVGVGGEFFRRKGDLDITFGLSWQKMGPSDGNWLGKGKQANVDTDFVQFRNFGLIGVDAAFIWRNDFSEYVGMHYGAGLGLAMVTGKILRISAAGCTGANAGNENECRPSICPPTGCTESVLVNSEGTRDGGPGDPHRYKESSVPGAIPIVNMLIGMNFRLPDVKGFEMRVEGGFYNAFVIGLTAGYLF